MAEQRYSRAGTGTGPRTRYIPKRKICNFCVNKNEIIDYKNTNQLRHYISDRGKIEPRRRSGVCARHQRVLSLAIKRSRHLALLPYVASHTHRTGVTAIPREVRENREPKEVKEVKETKEIKEIKKTEEIKETKETKE